MLGKQWPVMIDDKKTTTLNVVDRGGKTLAIERWNGGLILVSWDEAAELAFTLCQAVTELEQEISGKK